MKEVHVFVRRVPLFLIIDVDLIRLQLLMGVQDEGSCWKSAAVSYHT
jgi:hypothetical protein